MNPLSLRLEELQERDRELKARLAQLGEMRPGSLVERYRKCGKPNCHCARPGDRGHGPMWMVTHAVEGKTVSKAIPPAWRLIGPEPRLPNTSAFANWLARWWRRTSRFVMPGWRSRPARLPPR